jgi:hypothetical protein
LLGAVHYQQQGLVKASVPHCQGSQGKNEPRHGLLNGRRR